MFRIICAAIALVAVTVFAVPQEADATGLGLFQRIRQNRQAVRNVRAVRQLNSKNVVFVEEVRHAPRVVQRVEKVYRAPVVQRVEVPVYHQRATVVEKVVEIPVRRTVRAVEVPGVRVERVLVRDAHGRAIVQERFVRDHSRSEKIIIQRQIIRGY